MTACFSMAPYFSLFLVSTFLVLLFRRKADSKDKLFLEQCLITFLARWWWWESCRGAKSSGQSMNESCANLYMLYHYCLSCCLVLRKTFSTRLHFPSWCINYNTIHGYIQTCHANHSLSRPSASNPTDNTSVHRLDYQMLIFPFSLLGLGIAASIVTSCIEKAVRFNDINSMTVYLK